MKSNQNNGTLSAALMMRVILMIPSALESYHHYRFKENTQEKQQGLLISSSFDFFASMAQVYSDNRNKHAANTHISIAKLVSSTVKFCFALAAYCLSLNQDKETEKKNKEHIKWLNMAHEICHWIHHALSAGHLIQDSIALVNYNKIAAAEEVKYSMNLESQFSQLKR